MSYNSDTWYPARDDTLTDPMIRLANADRRVDFLAYKIEAALALIEGRYTTGSLQEFTNYGLTDILRATTYP